MNRTVQKISLGLSVSALPLRPSLTFSGCPSLLLAASVALAGLVFLRYRKLARFRAKGNFYTRAIVL
jgi:hypothetical protein